MAEFAIPFKSLSFPSGNAVWGFNLARHINRKLEEDRWSGARLELTFLQLSEAGEVTGLTGMTQGIGLDIRPFLGGRWLRLGAPGTDDWSGKPGLDVTYNVTPSLKLTTTVNTDFGETEVDARQINLSRFSILFPEKRSFFLEDAGVFTFASTGPPPPGGIPGTGAEIHPFFSRQVGLLAGEEVPIDIGVKLTGKAGRTDVGLLDVRTRDQGAVPDRNFFVGRVRRNILQQSYIGAIFTDGHPSLSSASRTVGADVRLATSRLFGKRQNLTFTGYALRSINQGVSGRDWSYGITGHYPNDKFNPQFVVREIQENFRPGIGFVQRRNLRLFRAGGGYNPRPRDFLGIQQMNFDLYFTKFTRLDNGETESWDVVATLWDWHFKSGDNWHGFFDFQHQYERLFTPFTISPGVVLPPGEYDFTRWKHVFGTATRRRLSGMMTWSHGAYWSGSAQMLQASMTYKAPPKFTFSLTSNQTFAELPQGDFTARIFGMTVAYAVSPFLSLSNLVQYDNLSRNLGWQSRLRWTLKPGNDVFLAFNQGWIEERETDAFGVRGDYRFRVQDSKVSAKVQYTTRF